MLLLSELMLYYWYLYSYTRGQSTRTRIRSINQSINQFNSNLAARQPDSK